MSNKVPLLCLYGYCACQKQNYKYRVVPVGKRDKIAFHCKHRNFTPHLKAVNTSCSVPIPSELRHSKDIYIKNVHNMYVMLGFK